MSSTGRGGACDSDRQRVRALRKEGGSKDLFGSEPGASRGSRASGVHFAQLNAIDGHPGNPAEVASEADPPNFHAGEGERRSVPGNIRADGGPSAG